MTSLQEQQIIKLRKIGDGYKKIADSVGVSRDQVRYFCKANGLDNEELDVCRECGEKLTQPKTGRRRFFCSDKCRYSWWGKHRELRNIKAVYTITCAGCNNDFESYGNAKRKYCSHKCYVADRFGEAV